MNTSKNTKLHLFYFLFLLSLPLKAYELSASGREYIQSCGYFSTIQADIEIKIKDSHIRQDSRLFLEFGWNGFKISGVEQIPFEWSDKNRVELRGTNSSWKGLVSATIHERTSSQVKTNLVFVIHVMQADGQSYYLNGGSSMGYYRIPTWNPGTTPCVSSSEDKPEMTVKNISTVTKG